MMYRTTSVSLMFFVTRLYCRRVLGCDLTRKEVILTDHFEINFLEMIHLKKRITMFE